MLTIILMVSICVFIYAGYKLVTIVGEYHKSDTEYADLKDKYITVTSSSVGEDSSEIKETENADESPTKVNPEDVPAPLQVDFDSLRAINPDIVGWLYIEAIPEISYPICRGEDNDFYLHHTFEKQYLFAGSIFESYENSPDFSDPNTIIYGHNMKNRSMFGRLQGLKDPEVYAASPYFWILTPDGNYRYHIFSVKETPYDSDVYTLFSGPGSELEAWEKKQQESSLHANSVTFESGDNAVVLSTCTGNDSVRLVVIGKCVSTERPVNRSEDIEAANPD